MRAWNKLSSGTVQAKNVESFKSLAMTDIKGMKTPAHLKRRTLIVKKLLIALISEQQRKGTTVLLHDPAFFTVCSKQATVLVQCLPLTDEVVSLT